MSRVRTYVRACESVAVSAGVPLKMARLRDAISKALFNRPYSAVIAAENSGQVLNIVLPPPYLEVAAEQYRVDSGLFASIFIGTEDAEDRGFAPPVLRAKTLKELVAIVKDDRFRAIRRKVASDPSRGEVILNTLAHCAGLACILATRFARRLQEEAPLRITLFSYLPTLVLDEGRALQLVRPMLGCRCELLFDVVGEGLTQDPAVLETLNFRVESPIWEFVRDLEPARFHDCYEAYNVAVARPDIAIAGYPDWIDYPEDEATAQWVIDLVQRDIPVAGMCYDDIEQDIISYVVRGLGLGETAFNENPAYARLDAEGLTTTHGRYLFAIDATQGSKGALQEKAWLYQAKLLSDLMQEQFDRYREHAYPIPGAFLRDAGRVFGFGTLDTAADVATGQAFKVVRDSAGIALSPLPIEPEPDWEPVDVERLRRADIILLVYEACRAKLFQPSDRKAMRDSADDFIGSVLESMPDDARDRMKPLLDALFNGESGVDAGIPIFVAAVNDDVAGVRAAVAEGADVEQRDTEGWTVLAQAAASNAEKAVKALIEMGADPNAQTMMGHYPVTIALTRGNDAAALALLEGGADPDARSINDVSARSLYRAGVVGSPALLAWFASHGPT